MFCGCGGLSHGFARTGHFRVVLGNDIKKAALKTFVRNHSRKQPPPETLEGDIRSIPIHEIEEALERQGVAKGGLDCLIGGPPCQGFSQMRRSEERLADGLIRFKGYNKLDDDPRNDLVLRFLEIANALRPQIVLIENVPQMLRHGHNGVLGGLAANVTSMLEEMGYSSAVGVLNSADYGVPQLRERSFFLASRIGEMALPEPTHANPEDADASERGLLPWTTVRDALGDLPAVAPATETLGGKPAAQYPKRQVSDYALLMRSANEFPFNHLTRSYSERIIDIVRQMQPGETWDSASERMQKGYETADRETHDNSAEEGRAAKEDKRRSHQRRLDQSRVLQAVLLERLYTARLGQAGVDHYRELQLSWFGALHPSGRAPRHHHAGSGAVAIVRRSLPLHHVRESRRRYVHNRHGDGHDWRGCAAASGRSFRAAYRQRARDSHRRRNRLGDCRRSAVAPQEGPSLGSTHDARQVFQSRG